MIGRINEVEDIRQYFSDDQLELIKLFCQREIDFMIVGGTAVAYHGYPRNTKDLDLFVSNTEENVKNIFQAIDEFFGGAHPDIGAYEDFVDSGQVLRFGKGRNTTELLFDIDSIQFDEAIKNSQQLNVDDLNIPVIGFDDLIANKTASGRKQDEADVERLKQVNDLNENGPG